MKTKLGIFVMGTLSAFLLDPVSGKQRREKAREILAPLTKRLGRAKDRAASNQSLDISAVPSAMADATRSVVTTVQDRAGSVSAAVASRVGRGNNTDSDALSEHHTPDRGAAASNGSAAPSTDYRAEVGPKESIADPIPEGATNDPTLVARIESELFRDETLPKGKMNIDAVNGMVTIRGSLDDNNLANDVVERIRAVEGVADVTDLLQRN